MSELSPGGHSVPPGRRIPDPIVGDRLILVAGVLGVAGLVATLLFGIWNTRQALYSYLGAFTYWSTIAVGALIWIQSFHAAKNRWAVVVRRPLEAQMITLPLLAVLFIPIAIGIGKIYPWAHPSPTLEKATLALMKHQHPYLNVPFFVARAYSYFATWIVTSFFLYRWSVRQDKTGDVRLTLRQRYLGPAMLPAVALTFTFASFDWQMSLKNEWFSTIFGVYMFAGGFLGSIAIAIVLTTILDRRGQMGDLVRPAHYHSMGKLLLAFVAFWGYIAFSQFMLQWIGDLPAENVWYLQRMRDGWGSIAILLMVGHFFVPFILLLSSPLKRKPLRLSAVALWMLIAHWFDCYWVVMPRLQGTNATPHWTDLTAFVGIGGVCVAFAALRLRHRAMVPLRDPYLFQSAEYSL